MEKIDIELYTRSELLNYNDLTMATAIKVNEIIDKLNELERGEDKMLKVNIEYWHEDVNDIRIDITSVDTETKEKHNRTYYENSNWYDMSECLEDFISRYIEKEDECFEDEED